MSDNNSPSGLRKELKLSNMITMAAGGMIAAWMVEIKLWYELSGPGSVFALLTLALLILPLCFIYSEMSSMMPYAGGQNIWVSNALGKNSGFAAFWMIMLLYIMAMPTVAYGIASMMGYIFPITTLQVKILAAAIIIFWFFLTNREIKVLAKLQSILFWSTLIISLSADIYFILSGKWHLSTITPMFTHGVSGWAAAVGLLVMKFVGFDIIPQLSEESDFPKKDLWKAFVGSIGCTVLVYGLAVIAVGGVVSSEWVANTDIVDPRVADICGAHWLGLLIVIMGTGTCITTLSSFWLSASRILYGAAKQHQVTQRFTNLNKFGQPQFANLIVGILSIFFTVFAPDAWINYIYTIYGVAAGAVYLLVTISFLKTRQKHPEWERPFRLKFGTFFGIWSICFCFWVLYVSIKEMNLGAWIVMLVYVLLGLAFWGYMKHMQKADPEGWKPVTISPDTVGHETDVLN